MPQLTWYFADSYFFAMTCVVAIVNELSTCPPSSSTSRDRLGFSSTPVKVTTTPRQGLSFVPDGPASDCQQIQTTGNSPFDSSASLHALLSISSSSALRGEPPLALRFGGGRSLTLGILCDRCPRLFMLLIERVKTIGQTR